MYITQSGVPVYCENLLLELLALVHPLLIKHLLGRINCYTETVQMCITICDW